MVDISAIAGTVSALKGASDIAKAMIGLSNAQAIQAKVIELNSQILAAQSSAFTANDERTALIEKLEAEVVKLKTWDAEKQHYQLVELADGVSAYTMKEEMRASQPARHLCPTCYEQGQKSIMQTEHRNPGRAEVMVCHRRGTDLYIHGSRDAGHKNLARRSTR